jgi:hypothetical protein
MEVLHMFLFKRFTKLKDTNNDDDNYDFYKMELETRNFHLTGTIYYKPVSDDEDFPTIKSKKKYKICGYYIADEIILNGETYLDADAIDIDNVIALKKNMVAEASINNNKKTFIGQMKIDSFRCTDKERLEFYIESTFEVNTYADNEDEFDYSLDNYTFNDYIKETVENYDLEHEIYSNKNTASNNSFSLEHR